MTEYTRHFTDVRNKETHGVLDTATFDGAHKAIKSMQKSQDECLSIGGQLDLAATAAAKTTRGHSDE